MIGNKLLTLLSNMCTNVNLTDMETCYKAFRGSVIRNLDLRDNRFGFEPEITAKIARSRCRIYEVGFSYGRIAHVLLWCGLAVASLVISIPKIYSGVTQFPLRPTGPLHTSDSYLKFATGVSGLSKNLISIFQS